MTTTIVNQIAELLLPLILSDVQVTRTHIQVLQDQLRSLLALKMVLLPDALIRCLSEIVIRRRKQRTIRLPSAVNLLISQYLPISDARKYLVGTNLLPGQIKNQMEKRREQMEKRREQREKEYQKLLKEKYSWSWKSLIEEEYKKGRTLEELKPFITAYNIPGPEDRSLLWRSLIKAENKKGRTLKELIPFMTAQDIPDELIHSSLWDSIIMEEYYTERMSFDELMTFLTEQNSPYYHFFRFKLITEQYDKGKRSFDELIPIIVAEPNQIARSHLWEYLIEREYKKGRVLFDELKPFVTAQNSRELREVLWKNFFEIEYDKGVMIRGMTRSKLLLSIERNFRQNYDFLFPRKRYKQPNVSNKRPI
jgi:hypothetical protein